MVGSCPVLRSLTSDSHQGNSATIQNARASQVTLLGRTRLQTPCSSISQPSLEFLPSARPQLCPAESPSAGSHCLPWLIRHFPLLLFFSRSVVSGSVTPWTAALQASLSFTVSQSFLELMSIELVLLSNHLILCRPPLRLPSIFPSVRVFSSESILPSGGQSIGTSASASVL